MSAPSFLNIDKWLFELQEGNLSPRQLEELQQFLDAHPEFAPDADAWQGAKIEAEPVEFPNISNLEKKPLAAYFFGISAVAISLLALYFIGFNNETAKYSYQPIDNTLSTNKSNLEIEDVVVRFNEKNNTALLINSETKIIYAKNKEAAKTIENSSLNTFSKTPSSTKKQINVKQNTSTISTISNQINDINIGLENKNIETINTQNLTQLNTDNPNIEYTPLTGDAKQAPELENVIASLTNTEEDVALASTEKSSTKSAKSKSSTLKRKFNASVRKLRNMMDNPVALRNYRDPVYHTPLASDFTFNPAMTGTQVTSKVQATSRVVALGNEREQFTSKLAFDSYLQQLRGGIGVDLTHITNNKGLLQSYEIGLSYSPKFTVKKVISVEPAIRFKMGNKTLNTNKLIAGTQVEENRGTVHTMFANNEQPIGNSLWYRDIGAGLLINTPWFYVGGSIDNLGSHYANIYSNTISDEFNAEKYYNAQIGTDYKALRKNIKLSTYVLYQNRGNWNEAWLGTNLNWSNFHIGAGISTNLEPAMSLGFDSQQLRLIYNTDYTRSYITNRNQLNHQITLRYKFKPNRYAMRILNK